MNRDWIKLLNWKCKEYVEGVNSFIEVAKNTLNGEGKTRCPCKNCINVYCCDIKSIEEHLYKYGISPLYDPWVYHGEKADLSRFVEQESSVNKEVVVSSDSEHTSQVNKETVLPREPTPIRNIEARGINDLRGPVLNNDDVNEASTGNNERVPRSAFEELLNEARQQLYPGCEQFSMFSFLVKLMHMKIENNWDDKSFDMLLKLLEGVFPGGSSLPGSYRDAKKRLSEMGLGYHAIHACKYDCILFWREYVKCEHCPMCGESRYKVNNSNGKKLPQKVLYHFPLIPRLQRLFSLKHIAHEMRWHKDKRIGSFGVLRHPADAEGWKHFDKQFPWFAAEPRNVRLSLALDGFNPFENTSPPHSMFPVILTPYNLPPSKCMKETFSFMSLLIPGPQSPGKEIDIYLQPLIAELKQLWTVGVRTFDSSKGENFQLHAALLWTISDLPIYGDISGWNTKGYKACPICYDTTISMSNDYTISMRLREKFFFTGHRCYLPADHAWRKSKNHNGREEHRLQPKIRNGEEILQEVNGIRFSRFGKNPTKQEKKRKRNVHDFNWTKKSIFFELPYWSKLMLRHKLDVISVERSICDNLLNILLDMDGKTTDTLMARIDLEELEIRKELHIQKSEDKYLKPHASYTLKANERVEFCKFLRSVKFPLGFPSSISQCVDVTEGKVFGLRSYDFHILIHRLLPIGTRPYLPEVITTTITEMCNFFRKLCTKTVRSHDLNKLQDEIVMILCKFEKLFPPAFFDLMIHLAVHLPYEAKIVGPVRYNCMHPFRQSLNKLKQYVKDKTCPEGSIADAYSVTESLKFCSMYVDGIEPGSNRKAYNNCKVSVFKQKARLIGEPTSQHLSVQEMGFAHWHILIHCDESKPYLKQHAETLKPTPTSALNLLLTQQQQFPNWFKNQAKTLHQEGNISDELYTLALGPDCCANSYIGCIVNGLRFHTKDHDSGQTIQNSGITVTMPYLKDKANFYGELYDVLELKYNNKRVLLFKCIWFDTFKKGRYHNEKGFISINVSDTCSPHRPFILVDEAEQVFYMDDYKFGKNWKVVQFVQPGHLWDIPEIENDEEVHEDQSSEPRDIVLTRKVLVDAGGMEFIYLKRKDVEPVVVEGDVMEMKLNRFDDFTIDKEFSEDELEDDDSRSGYRSRFFDSLTSNSTDDEYEGGIWSL